MKPKKILFIEPFYKGSHKYFLDNLVKHSKHEIVTSTKNGVFWKWKFLESAISTELEAGHDFDIIIGSNMLNLATWVGMNSKNIGSAKLALYFHENQLTYPDNSKDTNRNEFFGFQNLTSSFCADRVFFNSEFHLKSFVKAGRDLSHKLPDNIPSNLFTELEQKSNVIPIGIDIERFDQMEEQFQNKEPVLLWNHRWEFDKNPELFLTTLIELKEEGLKFKLIMLGNAPKKIAPIFNEAKEKLKDYITQWGRVESFDEYVKLLWRADILPVTSNHDFFGISVLEAVYCHTYPLLPKRCAYPDHFEPDTFNANYYESDEEFKKKLKQLVLTFPANWKSKEMRQIVSGFDWNNIVGAFDQEMSHFS